MDERTKKAARVTWRYVSGNHLDGKPRTNAGWVRRGTGPIEPGVRVRRWSHRPRLVRAVIRIGATVTTVALPVAELVAPAAAADATYGLGTAASAWALYRARKLAKRQPIAMRRFRRTYTRPLSYALSRAIREAGATVNPYVPDEWLTISPDLAGLAPRLEVAHPMSPAELWARSRYTAYVEPVLRYLPDQAMRGYWWAQKRTMPFTVRIRRVRDWFRRPTEHSGPRVEIRIPDPYVSDDTKKALKRIVSAKLSVSDLQEHWEQVGDVTVGIFRVKEHAPTSVSLPDIAEYIDACREAEFIVGLTVGDRPVKIDLDGDSPHIACSAGSGAGKSVLAMLIAVQVLRKGGKVIILDRKGSHRWARGLAGITYCTQARDMHAALIGAADLADRRNTQAMEEDDDWDPGHRVFIIFEEMNATVALLRQWWENNREKSDPKTSPAITAFREIMFMGRSAKVNLFGVAQMLTANTTGGPESRENFGVRALARYTLNNWRMLAPECPMPRKSSILGRWQFVVAGAAIETQVAYLHAHEARALAVPVSASTATETTADDRLGPDGTSGDTDTLADPLAELVTLSEAINMGVVVGKYSAIQKRLQRARKDDKPGTPVPVDRRGRADLYRVGDLAEWDQVETASEMAGEQS
jgi:hypothetical protein